LLSLPGICSVLYISICIPLMRSFLYTGLMVFLSPLIFSFTFITQKRTGSPRGNMDYIGPIIRPPNEADSILLQVTTGCSHNACSFCGIYKNKPFSIKPDKQIDTDLDYAAKHFPSNRRVFLCDGDALIIPQKHLESILIRIKEKLPRVTRITTYANAKSIARKSDQELRVLRRLGLKQFHIGLESGDDITLQKVKKYGTAAFIIEQCQRAKAAKMKLFVTILLGLGGAERSKIHAELTGKALSQIDPHYVGALSLMMVEESPLYTQWKEGYFTLPSPDAMLRELRTIIANTDVSLCLFFANHASNYLPINARLPREKEKTITRIDQALRGNVPLKPEWLRGL